MTNNLPKPIQTRLLSVVFEETTAPCFVPLPSVINTIQKHLDWADAVVFDAQSAKAYKDFPVENLDALFIGECLDFKGSEQLFERAYGCAALLNPPDKNPNDCVDLVDFLDSPIDHTVFVEEWDELKQILTDMELFKILLISDTMGKDVWEKQKMIDETHTITIRTSLATESHYLSKENNQ